MVTGCTQICSRSGRDSLYALSIASKCGKKIDVCATTIESNVGVSIMAPPETMNTKKCMYLYMYTYHTHTLAPRYGQHGGHVRCRVLSGKMIYIFFFFVLCIRVKIPNMSTFFVGRERKVGKGRAQWQSCVWRRHRKSEHKVILYMLYLECGSALRVDPPTVRWTLNEYNLIGTCVYIYVHPRVEEKLFTLSHPTRGFDESCVKRIIVIRRLCTKHKDGTKNTTQTLFGSKNFTSPVLLFA